MSDLLERVKKLVALAASDSRGEASNAAIKACELIRKHELVLSEKPKAGFAGTYVGSNPPKPSNDYEPRGYDPYKGTYSNNPSGGQSPFGDFEELLRRAKEAMRDAEQRARENEWEEAARAYPTSDYRNDPWPREARSARAAESRPRYNFVIECSQPGNHVGVAETSGNLVRDTAAARHAELAWNSAVRACGFTIGSKVNAESLRIIAEQFLDRVLTNPSMSNSKVFYAWQGVVRDATAPGSRTRPRPAPVEVRIRGERFSEMRIEIATESSLTSVQASRIHDAWHALLGDLDIGVRHSPFTDGLLAALADSLQNDLDPSRETLRVTFEPLGARGGAPKWPWPEDNFDPKYDSTGSFKPPKKSSKV